MEHIRYSKFLEGTFEWDIVAYSFFPYYWADKNDGENNIGYAPDGNYNTLSGKSD